MPKSNIRKPALEWFFSKYPTEKEPVIASKFYKPHESWSDSRVWFFQVPLDLLQPNKIKHIHLVSKNHLAGDPFLHFKVPTLFLLKNLKSFEVDQKANIIRLYLSAEAVDMYKEVRRGSKLDFKTYLQSNNQ